MFKHLIALITFLILLSNVFVIAQMPRTVYEKYHHSLSLQSIYTPIKFVHENEPNISSAAVGIQLRYNMHFPLSTFYSLGIGIYTGVNTYKFNRPNEPLGYLNDVELSGAIGHLQDIGPDTFLTPSLKDHFSFATVGFPIYVTGVFPVSNNLLLVASTGINVNISPHLNVYHDQGGYGNETLLQTNMGEIVVIRTDTYLNSNPQLGFMIEFGPEYTFRNGTIFSISLAANLNLTTQNKFKYDLYPDLEEYTSTGYMETSGSYFGLSLNYIFVKFLRRV